MVQYRPFTMPLSQHFKGKLKNYLSFLGIDQRKNMYDKPDDTFISEPC